MTPDRGGRRTLPAMPADGAERLADALAAAAPGCRVVFRADDIGAPGTNLERLLALFLEHRASLALAVVPAWLTRPRAEHLLGLLAQAPDLFLLHQHGWRHMDHEAGTAGHKKCEFGPARGYTDKLLDLQAGRRRLADLLGQAARPLFTPPWNRFDADTGKALAALQFKAVSTFRKAGDSSLSQGAPAGLPDLPMTVDLHTRKEPTPEAAFEGLFRELRASLAEGWCGIMIHHRIMDDASFVFLETLLTAVGRSGVKMAALDEGLV